MSKQITFSVSTKGNSGHNVTREVATGLHDRDGWKSMIAGSTDTEIDNAIHELALQQWVVKCQAAGRGKLSGGKVAVQAAVNGYKYGAKGSSAPVVDGTALGLNEEQIKALKASGVTVV